MNKKIVENEWVNYSPPVSLTAATIHQYGGVIWSSPPPEQCDLCQKPIAETFVDGRTRLGSWACMCESCHVEQGGMLGRGLGQKYQLIEGHYQKVS